MYGRMDDMLSLRGAHVYPSAIEDVVRRIPDISEAYEIVVDKRDGQDHVTVRCEPRPEIPQTHSFSGSAAVNACRKSGRFTKIPP
jgi:phenylacetate-CoA ligase